ncbi:MAG TPA: dihydropteroate synthase [Egibacteraceae bacterium]|nr:dihydropteroate synthase [Egibacteraceae bacterium]
MTAGLGVRIEDATLGADAQVRLVITGVSDPAGLRSKWAAAGAAVTVRGERLRATTTVDSLARAAGRALPTDEARALDAALRSAVSAWRGPSPQVSIGESWLDCSSRTLIAGVVNVTPDSFSDGGALFPGRHPQTAVAHAKALIAEGADLLDIGGESTRPGSHPVPAAEERRRVIPVIEALADSGVVLSIDTRKPEVAAEALKAGAAIVNDVSGGADRKLLELVADNGAGYVLMHTPGLPLVMQSLASYRDVVAEVYEFLAEGLVRCEQAGMAPEKILVDPGIGFGKTVEHNLALLRALPQFRGLGRPVLLGASRKSFLGALLDGAGPDERLEGSLACVARGVWARAGVLRVHDVAASVRVARVTKAILAGSERSADQ